MVRTEPDGRTPGQIWGEMLKHYRDKAELSQDQLGDLLPYSSSHVASVETGRRSPSADFAARCDDALRTGESLSRLREMLLKQAAVPSWFRPWVEVEQEAITLRGFGALLIPGLFQTEQYARVVLEGDDEAVAARMERQAVLTKEDPPTVRYLLDEVALTRPIGSAEIMAGQLDHLEQLVHTERAHIQVSPSGSVPSVGGSFDLATVDGEALGYLEAETQGMVLTKREDVLDLEGVYEKILGEALPRTASLDSIRRLKEEWQDKA